MKHDFVKLRSHDLRSPLNGIIGFAELLRDGKAGPLNAAQREYLGDIIGQGQELIELIQAVLDLSQPDVLAGPAQRLERIEQLFPCRRTASS